MEGRKEGRVEGRVEQRGGRVYFEIILIFYLLTIMYVFRCVLASLHKGLSVRPSVYPYVR